MLEKGLWFVAKDKSGTIFWDYMLINKGQQMTDNAVWFRILYTFHELPACAHNKY